MRTLPNVVRRGAIFHFRRVVPKDLRDRIGRTELVRSLETSDIPDAKQSSRRLYLLSEGLFEAVRDDPMLSKDQIEALLRDFYEHVLSQENAVRLRLGPIPEEVRQKRIAAYAEVAKSSKEALARNDLFGSAVIAEAMLRKHGLMDKVSLDDIHQVRQAMLRAGIDVAEAVKARYEGDFNYEPKDKLLREALEAITVPLPPPQQPQPASKPVPRLSELTPRFLEDRADSKHWRAQSGNQARKTFELFVAIIGDRPVNEYERFQAGEFKDALQKLPADYGKAAEYRGMTPQQIITAYAALAVGERENGLAIRTVQRHFSAMSALWEWLQTRGYVTENLFTGFKFPKTVVAHQQRNMWTPSDLQALFTSPLWRGCQSPARRTKPGTCIRRDEKFWLPLVGVFSAMREEEICQLHMEDVRHEDGVWYFDINARLPRHVKNRNAVRRVPIHAELVRLGFVQYVEGLRNRGETRVFPDLEPGGADGRFGHAFTKWFSRYRKDVGLYQDKLDFHSFRHTAITLMQRAEVPEPVIQSLVGHAGTGETARYTKGFTLAHLKAAIDKINPNLDLSWLHAEGRSNGSTTSGPQNGALDHCAS